MYSQANDSVTESVVSSTTDKKVFNITKVKKENLVLMRNKIPKVFWIQKHKSSSRWRENHSNNASSTNSDTPFRKVYGDVFKVERFRENRKRPCVRPVEKTKIPERICNDYSDQITFKIEKVRRHKRMPSVFQTDAFPKLEDIDSASTKRSSRQSSKQKACSNSPMNLPEVEPINLVKIEENYETPVLKADPEPLPYERDLLMSCKDLNEELDEEIQDYNMPESLNQEL